MFKLLSYNHPFTFVLLFVLAVALRVPSFHSNYFETDEAYYLTAAERIVDGGVQYVDTWDNKPPVLTWFYTLFVWIFGSVAPLAIRIFTCIYLFLGAVKLNQIAVDNRILDRFSLLPGFLFLLLSSVPWYAQEMNGELLMSLPIIWGVAQVLRVKERSKANQHYMFLAGLLLGLSFMIKYQGIFIFLGLLGAYLSAHTPRLEEVFSYLAGFALSILTFVAILYFNGALAAYWEIGFLYNIDYLFLGKNPSENISIGFNLLQYLQLWGVFLLIAVSGIFYFRANYFTHSIRLRKVELIIMVWFGAAVLTILVGAGRLYLHYFYLLVPPLSIYAAKFFEFKLRNAVKMGVMFLGLLVPIFTYSVWAISAYPDSFSFVDEYLTPNGWVDGFRKELNEPHPLAAEVDREKIENGVLVLDFEPRVYQWLDVPCATRFTNFSIAYYKFDMFHEGKTGRLYSGSLTDAEVYTALKEELPEYFIDTEEMQLFPIMQDKMPLLLGQFTGKKVPAWDRNYIIYSRD